MIRAIIFAVMSLGCFSVYAGPFVDFSPFDSPAPGAVIPVPVDVPGKEYSNRVDKDSGGAVDPEQAIAWDGAGGVADTFDYTGSRGFRDVFDREVDAMAHQSDALFDSVKANTSALLFSTDNDPNIYYEPIGGPPGGIWAAPAMINQHGVDDVDGLEVWGRNGPTNDDANRYSIEGDPVIDPDTNQRVAVWSFFPFVPVGGPEVFVEELGIAISLLEGLNLAETQDLNSRMDLDAMMISGNSIIWSIDPITLVGGTMFDGGEIFLSDGILTPATYLNHGGHLWNTAFDVSATFGTASENVNALEAVSTTIPPPPPDPNYGQVPEPSSLFLFTGGIALLGWIRRRGKRC